MVNTSQIGLSLKSVSVQVKSLMTRRKVHRTRVTILPVDSKGGVVVLPYDECEHCDDYLALTGQYMQ
eukprot:COSAG01_NODE_35962_length_524_cov_1.054118_1_plen_67_part_00